MNYKLIYRAAGMAVLSMVLLAWGNKNPGDGGGGGKPLGATDSFTDRRDNKKYGMVKIGGQTWMAENLNIETANSKCYDDDPANCNKYGRLYNWNDARTACPSGWHLPSDVEWTQLTDYVGGSSTAGKKLKSTSGWNNNGNGTDEYGFSALPGGYGGSFINVGYDGGFWWSATEYAASYAWLRSMYYLIEYVDRFNYDKANEFSVRWVRD